ncbi:hypothetical protein DID75_01930 [Candidatus Marinamargulisbacteria bacterium SCGC AG-410-N11]|nr:hypothetical protein DID75_01930 [Candidatus Marinamargulisbacteria bacterium SCGC AG-410-N11]
MKLFCLFILSIMIFESTLLLSVPIKDIKKNDISYKAVKNVVNQGFLPLYSNNAFKPNQPLSRKEAAVIINKILSKMNSNQDMFSLTEISQLKEISGNFKNSYSSFDTNLNGIKLDTKLIKEEQKNIQHDMIEINDKMKTEIQTLKKQRTIMWFGIGGSILLSLFIR